MTRHLLAASIGALGWARNSKPQADHEPSRIWMAALFMIAWMGTFEIERFVILNPAIVSPWNLGQFRQIAWTMWWTMIVAGGFVVAYLAGSRGHARGDDTLWKSLAGIAIAFTLFSFYKMLALLLAR